MRELDRDAISAQGVPGLLLMETAGRAVARALRWHWPAVRRPLMLCGPGNNGGDGFVAARALAEWDARIRPQLVVSAAPERLAPDARRNLERAERAGLAVRWISDAKELAPLLARADLIVDALFGVGLKRPIGLPLSGWIDACRDAGLPSLALDVASGVSSDTGDVLGASLSPALTVALACPKLGQVLRPQPGALAVADIGLPRASLRAVGVRQHLVTAEQVEGLLPERPADAHKGRFGHVLIVAGSPGKTGAGVLAARGALHAGAGLITLAVPASLQERVAVRIDEVMTLGLEDQGSGHFEPGALGSLLRELGTRDVLVIGPGLGTAPQTVEAVRRLLQEYPGPAVVDADALNACAGDPPGLRGPGPRVLTPHPAEAARLLGCRTDDVVRDRCGSARRLADAARAHVILKGARTLCVRPDGELSINPSGGPGLATGGSGDVLSGVVGALLGQGLGAFDAARAGVFLHGRAGERRAVGIGAAQIAEGLGAVWCALRCEVERGRERAHEWDGFDRLF